MKERTTFESINEELCGELTLLKTAEMVSWLSSQELDPQVDLSFFDEVAMQKELEEEMLTEDDAKTAYHFELMAKKASNDILLRAVETMRRMDDQDLDEGVEGITDCGEWLQLNQTVIRNRVKSYLRGMQGTGLDLDDLVQEASLAIITCWDNYDPNSGTTRNTHCWNAVYNRIRTMYRAAHAEKRDCTMVDSMNAVRLAHFGLEDVRLDGSMTWTSLAQDAYQFKADSMKVDLDDVMATFQDECRNVVSMLAAGYTQVEIADILGFSQSHVSYLASTGRKRIKAAIA